MSIEYSEAKDIFLRFGGSHFFMAREGIYDHYKSLMIPKELERQWSLEECERLIELVRKSKLADANFGSLCNFIKSAQAAKPLAELLAFFQQEMGDFDTFSLLRFGEESLRLCESLKRWLPQGKALEERLCNFVVEAAKTMQKKQINVDPHFQNVLSDLDALHGDAKREIVNRIERLHRKVNEAIS